MQAASIQNSLGGTECKTDWYQLVVFSGTASLIATYQKRHTRAESKQANRVPSSGLAKPTARMWSVKMGRLMLKLCKLVFILSTPGSFLRICSGYHFLNLKGQPGIAAFSFLFICPRTFSSVEGYILNSDLRFCWGVYATSGNDKVGRARFMKVGPTLFGNQVSIFWNSAHLLRISL